MARPNLFGADIAGAIFQALGNAVLDATLVRPLVGERDPANLTAGRNTFDPGEGTPLSYACKGFTDDYSAREIDGTIIQHGDRKVMLLGKSLPDDVDPAPNDRVTIEGRAWRVVSVKRDPAGATFLCQVRQ